MTDTLLYCVTYSTDPYCNLALEEYLTDTVKTGQCILYLWQNRHTVVIGRNQNAWRECRTTKLNEDGGTLARRLSGGGAVYHDMGNLNFTFSVPEEDYDLAKQQRVIVEACRMLGVDAKISGRNDILANGRKFSGNSFYSHQGKSFHNGTLLINADMCKMTTYLAPSKLKLEAKGVDSVRARVVNLCELEPNITVDNMREAMLKAFCRVYGLEARAICAACPDKAAIERRRARFGSYEWVYGRNAEFPLSIEKRFIWGELAIQLNIKRGICADAAVYTDAMDASFALPLREAICGSRFDTEELCKKVLSVHECAPYAADICRMLHEQNI